MNDQTRDTSLVEILLVEDNPDDEQLTVEALTQYRLANHLHVVRDGEEALNFLFSKGPYVGNRLPGALRVVLLDIKLPKVDGLEVLEALRSNPETAELPVVLLTSSAEEKDLRRGYDLKVNSYIVKPVDFSQFVEAVKEIGLYWAVLNKLPSSHTDKPSQSNGTPAGSAGKGSAVTDATWSKPVR